MSVGGRRESADATTDGPGDRDNMTGAAIDALGTPDNVTGTVIDQPAPVDLITSSATQIVVRWQRVTLGYPDFVEVENVIAPGTSRVSIWHCRQ